MRITRIERLLKLIQALQSRRAQTAAQLAKVTGVSKRTIFRDIELLSHAGIRYTYNSDTRRYSADKETLLPPVSLSHTEALTLMLATRHVITQQFLPDDVAAASAGLKLESMLPSSIRDDCGTLLQHLEIRSTPHSDTTSIAGTLALTQRALSEQNKIRIRYDSYFEGKEIEVVLHPYRLAYIHRGWYLIALTEGIGEVRTYKVERILSLSTLTSRFRMLVGFKLDEYFGNAWQMIRGDTRHHVKIRFLPKVAGNVDEIVWHKTQQTTYQEDGSLLFEVDVDGIDEISWWVLGYGDQAEVLDPPELKNLIAQRVRNMHAHYHGNGRPEITKEGTAKCVQLCKGSTKHRSRSKVT